jgi:hypothetical protein
MYTKHHCYRTQIVISNNVRQKASRHFRNKKKEYLKAKINKREAKVRPKISETCRGASVTFRMVTSIEPI